MRREIKILVITEFLIALGLGILGPFEAIFAEKITKDSSTIGYSYAAFWLTVGVLSPIFGRLSDKYNKKIFLVTGGLLAFISSILFNLVSTFFQLILIEILSGISTSLFIPVYHSLIADLTSKKQRGKEYGIIDSVSYITYGFSAIIGTLIVSFLGLNFLFFLSGIFQLFSSVFIANKAKKI